ncbi:MAG: 23S rRNA (adenine(2503)-C(2))-methyltransferase RlmN [Spirochaetia bacterium]
MSEKQAVSALYPKELTEKLSLTPSFRGKQIFSWIQQKKVTDFSRMTNIPEGEQKRLSAGWMIISSRVTRHLDDPDGTVKFQIELSDGHRIEAVRLSDGSGRYTACLSTQAGCAMGCAFCRTGSLGFKRNLRAHEIVEQFLHIAAFSDLPVSNAVFMGMGEPLENYTAVERAVNIMNHPGGINIGMRKMVISTSGIVPGIRQLAEAGPPVRLAVSLITPRQEIRDKIMPGVRRYPLSELKEVLQYYQNVRKKRITLEIVLFKGLNDTAEDIRLLKDFIGDLRVLINLIPWNPLPGFPFREPDEADVKRTWEQMQLITGSGVYVRYNKGREVTGACGQLG